MKTKLIIITGTPGTGKSTLAKIIARKYGLFRLDVTKHYSTISTGYNLKKRCYEVNLQKFKRVVAATLRNHPEGIILDSHLSHLLPRRWVDLCIVVTCSNLKKLRRRLERRRYSKAKVGENVDTEIFQICLREAEEQRQRIIIVDSTKKHMMQTLLQKLPALLSQVKKRSAK